RLSSLTRFVRLESLTYGVLNPLRNRGSPNRRKPAGHMMKADDTPRTHHAADARARALAAILAEEFGHPFAVYDAVTGLRLLSASDTASDTAIEADAIRRLAEGACRVEDFADGSFHLIVPVPEDGQPRLV